MGDLPHGVHDERPLQPVAGSIGELVGWWRDSDIPDDLARARLI
jgi:hypothetical protein